MDSRREESVPPEFEALQSQRVRASVCVDQGLAIVQSL